MFSDSLFRLLIAVIRFMSVLLFISHSCDLQFSHTFIFFIRKLIYHCDIFSTSSLDISHSIHSQIHSFFSIWLIFSFIDFPCPESSYSYCFCSNSWNHSSILSYKLSHKSCHKKASVFKLKLKKQIINISAFFIVMFFC